MSRKDIDKQLPNSGKVENDHNRQGQQDPTQTHQARRTPLSRHDRDDKVGSDNQSRVRRETPRGRH